MLPTNRPAARIDPRVERIVPGTWWRLTNKDHPLASRPAPDQGLVLLAKEVHVVDGDDHTIVLQAHPLWSSSSNLKILRDELLQSFAPENEGSAIRELEIAEVMSRISRTAHELQSPPDGAKLLDHTRGKSDPSDNHSEEESELVSSVPEALLPGQDVKAAQSLIETRIAELKAQREWIEAKTRAMTEDMRLVQSYQEEKVASTVAGISTQQKEAERILQNVQTMRLFLGEEIEVRRLSSGRSAASDEPLTFLQKMLFLDEEIYISHIIDGFDHTQMDDLGSIFSRDRSVRDRMLPYERCVAITRIRRNPKERGAAPATITEALLEIEKDEQDKLIQILIRDGENIWMVIADEHTSNAQRLFPSRQEIENLFQKSSFHGREARVIAPDDVEYSEARSQHDTKALFYKRFLIMFWGLHERNGLFGGFMPKGLNWLEEAVHDRYLRFVHDDEDGIEDGMPSVHDFIAKANSKLTAKSRVIVHWKQAATYELAPSICSLNTRTYSTVFDASFQEDISLRDVLHQGTSLVVKAPVSKFAMRTLKERKFNAIVALKKYRSTTADKDTASGTPFDEIEADGYITLDDLKSSDVAYYIQSRKARRDYRAYLHIFHAAWELLRNEEAQINATFAGIDEDPIVLDLAIRAWRETHRWAIPSDPRQVAAVRKIAKAIKTATRMNESLSAETLQIGVKPSGEIFTRRQVSNSGVFPGTRLPWMHETLQSGRAASEITAPLRRRAGEVLLRDDTSGVFDTGSFPEGLMDLENRETALSMRDNKEPMDLFLKLSLGCESELLDEFMTESFRRYRTEKEAGISRVFLPKLCLDFGVVHGPDGNGRHRAWKIGCIWNASSLAIRYGLKDRALSLADGLFKDPEGAVENLSERPPVRLSVSRLSIEEQLHQGAVLEPSWIHRPSYSFHLFSYGLAEVSDIRTRVASSFTHRTTPSVSDGSYERACIENAEKLSYEGSSFGQDFCDRIHALGF